MKKIIRTLTVLAFSLGLLTTGAVVPAEAQIGPLGGRVLLSKSSTGNVRVSGNLVKRSGKWVQLNPIGWIAPGQNSRTHAHIYDTDSFRAPSGCRTTAFTGRLVKSYTPGVVYKINDLTTINLIVKC